MAQPNFEVELQSVWQHSQILYYCMQIYARDLTGVTSSKLMYIQNAVVEDFFPQI